MRPRVTPQQPQNPHPNNPKAGLLPPNFRNTGESWEPGVGDPDAALTAIPDSAKPAESGSPGAGDPVLTFRTMRVRLDKLLVQNGLVTSRERAQALILAGRVLVNEQKIEKAGAAVPEDAAIRVLGQELRYVSRGGLKLEHALAHWKVDLTGRCCVDIGTSTGGFSDCMLQHGAAEVFAIDTGYGQIHARLRQDPRIHLIEKTNARFLNSEVLRQAGARDHLSFVAMDVSFISATLVLPAVMKAMKEHNRYGTSADHTLEAVILVKPQFEVGRELVGSGGIVRDSIAQQAAVEKVRAAVTELGAMFVDAEDSPILGVEGNKEFLLYSKFDQS